MLFYLLLVMLKKDGTFTASERRVQRVRKAVGDRTSKNWLDYTCRCRKKTWAHGFDWTNSEEVFDEIRKCMPTYRGITYDRIEKENGAQWPCLDENHPGSKFLHNGKFARVRKSSMVPVEYEGPKELENEEYPTILSTGRVLYHYSQWQDIQMHLMEFILMNKLEISSADAAKYDLSEWYFVRKYFKKR